MNEQEIKEYKRSFLENEFFHDQIHNNKVNLLIHILLMN